MSAPVIDEIPPAPIRSQPGYSENFEAWQIALGLLPEQMNALANYIAMQAVATAAGAYQGAHDPEVTYAKGLAVSSNGAIWVSLQDGNLGNDPIEGEWWTDPIGGLAITPDTPTTFTNKTISVDDNAIGGMAPQSFALTDADGELAGAAEQKAIPAGAVVGDTDEQELENKTIDAGKNDLVGVVTLDGEQELTGKTISTASNTLVGVVTAPQVVAEGAIAAGVAVALRSDGKVEVITSNVSGAPNTPYLADDFAPTTLAAAYDPDNDVVLVVYAASGDDVYAVAGTVSGSEIAFGAAFMTESIAGGIQKLSVCYSGGGKFAVGTKAAGLASIAIASVSGTTVTWGTWVTGIATYNTSSPNCAAVAAIAADGTVAIVGANTASVLRARAGTVSGTTITLGSNADVSSAASASNGVDACYDAETGKFAVVSGGKLTTFTAAGTTITWGTPATFDAASVGAAGGGISVTPIGGGRVAIAYTVSGQAGKLIIADINGSAPGFGAAVTFEASNCYAVSVAWDDIDEVGIVTWANGGNSYYGTAVTFTVAGASITLGSEFVFRSAAVFDSGSNTSLSCSVAFAGGGFFVGYRDGGNSNYVHGVMAAVDTVVDTNADDFIGFSLSAAEDDETLPIATVGQVASGLSGLTPGERYYVDHDGTLTTSNTSYALAGRALSATQLIVGL